MTQFFFFFGKWEGGQEIGEGEMLDDVCNDRVTSATVVGWNEDEKIIIIG